ncbi:MAG: hypothetical protein O6949_13480, partial [Chloroflexi bacterium]|nr:hypothetical protein [Chloroflexota bacterium]
YFAEGAITEPMNAPSSCLRANSPVHPQPPAADMVRSQLSMAKKQQKKKKKKTALSSGGKPRRLRTQRIVFTVFALLIVISFLLSLVVSQSRGF